MIKIGKPYITEDDEKAYLKAKVDISLDTAMAFTKVKEKMPGIPWRFYENYPPAEWKDGKAELWFSVDKKYKDALCTRSDAFVVAMLWYALAANSDIIFEAPISIKLFFGIKHVLIPLLASTNDSDINIEGPVTEEIIQTQNAVGTGMSCGVDSLYTLKRFTSDDIPDSFKLTHLVYINMGNVFHLRTIVPNADSMKLEDFYKKSDEIINEKIKKAAEVAKASNLQFVAVSSNIDEDFYRGGYVGTTLYRNCAGILALSGLFSKYYMSSNGATRTYINVSLYDESDNYETILETNLSSDSLEFRIPDYLSRAQKIEYISGYDLAQKYLDVCFNFNNCGECRKCLRTLLMIDASGRLEDFSKVFDIQRYKKERSDYIKRYVELAAAEKNPCELFAYSQMYKLAEKYNSELFKMLSYRV